MSVNAIPILRAIAIAMSFSIAPLVMAQKVPEPQPAITIAEPASAHSVDAATTSVTESRTDSPARMHGYREFAKASLAKFSAPEMFTLEFHQSTMVTRISTTGDFHFSGGTCVEGHTYSAGDRCTAEVSFQPTAPGHRTGALSVAHTASVTPLLTPIGGTAYAPAVSFTPALISTVPGTSSGGLGTTLNASSLTVDGGNNLYIADTGNAKIKMIDSSGVIKTLIGGGSISLLTSNGFGPQIKLNSPYGVAVDYSGTLYFSDQGDKIVGTYFLDNIAARSVGGGSTAENGCYTGSKCTPSAVALLPPTSLAVDPSGNIFVAGIYGNGLPGAALAEYTVYGSPSQFYEVGTTAYNYYSSSYAVGVDPFGYGNLYYTYLDPGGSTLSPTPLCYILGQNSAYTQGTAGTRFWEVAGSGTCGYSGDGVSATNAEISKSVGAFAWDPAGNFYFTDTGNNRVRRVDGATGVIHTIAGNGGSGYSGDGGPSTDAHLQVPFGLAVDSTGLVYFTNQTGTVGKTVIRSFGKTGYLNFGSLNDGTKSAAKTVLVSNVGNSDLNFTHTGFNSGSNSDFTLDPVTTTCNFTVPLPNGHNCTIGFFFTPAAAGARSAVYSLSDDTAAGVDPIQLTGTGVAPAAKAAISPGSATYSAQALNNSSSSKAFTVTNSGNATLTFTSITIAGTNASEFTQTHTCGSTLAASATCTVSVTFKPSATGARTATLSIATNGGTVTAALTGSGSSASAAPTVSSASLTFTSQATGSSSAAKTTTLSNPGGSTQTINSYSFSGTNAADFTQTHTCGSTLAAGASCTLSVVFKPAATGSRSATLTVVTSTGSAKVTLAGTAVAPAVKSSVSLASATNPAMGGKAIILSSTVSGNSSAVPTGQLQLLDGGKVIAESPITNGTATFSLSSMASGQHPLTAHYSGDNNHLAATSAELRQMVGPFIRIPIRTSTK